MDVDDRHQPLVSVIIPTYNRAHFIGETIQSVIDQTYKNWELIIVDDGSVDETGQVVQQFNDKRISYLPVQHTGYIGKTRNVGIRKAKGKYIAFLDSDDLWRSDKLQFQLSLLKKYPQASFVFSNGRQFGEGSVDPPNCDTLFVGNVFLEQLIYNRFCFYSPTIIFSRSVLDVTGLLDESAPTTRDVLFFYRMSYKYDGIFTNEHLVQLRKHTQNISTEVSEAAFVNSLKMYHEFLEKKMISNTHAVNNEINTFPINNCFLRLVE